MHQFLLWLSLIAGILSALAWFRSTQFNVAKISMLDLTVSTNLSHIVDPLKKQSQWNAIGAFLAGVAVLASVFSSISS